MSSEQTSSPVFYPGNAVSLSSSSHSAIPRISPRCADEVPRYLFRVTSPRTVGTTTTERASSREWDGGWAGRERDVFEYDDPILAERLRLHLRWQCTDECNFVSWTSSLLFAIQYARYHLFSDFGSPERWQIFIFVVDTRPFAKGTFIRDWEVLDALAPSPLINNKGDFSQLHSWRSGEFYFGEYLSRGRLLFGEGVCRRVSWDRLENLGLSVLCPEPHLSPHKWARSVVKMRERFDEPDRPTAEANVQQAICMANAFGGDDDHKCLFIAASLLSLFARDLSDPVILEGLNKRYPETSIASLQSNNDDIRSSADSSDEDAPIEPVTPVASSVGFLSKKLPEYHQCEMLLNNLAKHRRSRSGGGLDVHKAGMEGMTEAMSKMSVGQTSEWVEPSGQRTGVRSNKKKHLGFA